MPGARTRGAVVGPARDGIDGERKGLNAQLCPIRGLPSLSHLARPTSLANTRNRGHIACVGGPKCVRSHNVALRTTLATQRPRAAQAEPLRRTVKSVSAASTREGKARTRPEITDRVPATPPNSVRCRGDGRGNDVPRDRSRKRRASSIRVLGLETPPSVSRCGRDRGARRTERRRSDCRPAASSSLLKTSAISCGHAAGPKREPRYPRPRRGKPASDLVRRDAHEHARTHRRTRRIAG